jgi:L-fucose isomerase-like protein
MKQVERVKIGLLPVRRGMGFSETADVLRAKREAFAALEQVRSPVDWVDLEGVVPDGVAATADQIPAIVAHLKGAGVDGLFVIHCDFGLEEIIARVAKAVARPVLLWGGRDPAPDAAGERALDTQCGIFASGKVLQRYGVPFLYINNCRPGEPEMLSAVDRFARTVSVTRAFAAMRILLIGNRPKDFMSVMVNEPEILERFGIEVVPYASGRFFHDVQTMAASADPDFLGELRTLADKMDVAALTEKKLRNIAAMIVVVRRAMDQHQCAGATMECWSSLPPLLEVVPCQVIGELTDRGYPVACEADVHGAISSVLAQAANFGEAPTFFADLTIRHPENDNAELLWHCGPFPHSLRREAAPGAMGATGTGEWELKRGPVTILRFDGVRGDYALMAGEGKTVDGPKTGGTYAWFEVADWPSWERKLVEGPFIHHVSCLYGHVAQAVLDACRFMPGVSAFPL